MEGDEGILRSVFFWPRRLGGHLAKSAPFVDENEPVWPNWEEPGHDGPFVWDRVYIRGFITSGQGWPLLW